MSAQSILAPYSMFTDRSGTPLANGKIYIGTAGANPITNPVSVYFDSDLTVPAAQPVRTSGGYPLNNGSPARLFVDADEYSIVVQTSTGVTVYSALNSTLLATPVAVGIPQTAAELAAGVTPLRLVTAGGEVLQPGDVRRYCTAAETNHQAAFTNAHASAEVMRVPAGTWNIDHLVMDIDGRRMRTDGFATVIHQRTGNTNRRTIEVCASNVIIEDLKVTGNIATDTGEQQHGIFVSGDHPTSASANIENVHIGNVWGQDLRGDVVYIGAPAGFTTRNVTFGVIRGTNIYRNVVSVVGASYLSGAGVTTDGGCGYATFDVEPNVGGTASTDIIVGFVRGGVLQIAPPSAATMAQRIRILSVDLNPSYQPNSTPGYAEGGSSYALEIINAVWLRNCMDVYLGHLKVRDHTNFALKYIFNVGEQKGRGIRIGYLDSSGVGAAEVTLNTLLETSNVETLTIDDGDVTLQATTDCLVLGNSADKNTKCIINRMRINGTVQRFGTDCSYNQIIRNDANDVFTFRDIDRMTCTNSTITGGRLLSNVTGFTFIGVTATCSTSYFSGTCTNGNFINCSGGIETGSILQGSATYDPPSLPDGDGVTTTVTVNGAALGDIITGYSFSLDLQDVTLTAYIQAANTVEFRFQNDSGGVKDLSSGTLRVYVKKA